MQGIHFTVILEQVIQEIPFYLIKYQLRALYLIPCIVSINLTPIQFHLLQRSVPYRLLHSEKDPRVVKSAKEEQGRMQKISTAVNDGARTNQHGKKQTHQHVCQNYSKNVPMKQQCGQSSAKWSSSTCGEWPNEISYLQQKHRAIETKLGTTAERILGELLEPTIAQFFDK